MALLLGRTLEEIATTEVLAMIWPEDRDLVIEQATRLITGELTAYSQESRLLAGDGSPVWVHETATCVQDGGGNPLHFMSQFVDIGDRKQAEAELLESQRTIRFLFDGTPAPLVQLDAHSKICAANAALARLLGRDPIGLAITDVVHPDDLIRLAEDSGSIEPDTDWIIDFRVVRPDGSERLVRSHARVHHFDDGQFRSATATWNDITDAKQHEELLRVQASTDPLTGLPHRATFLDGLQTAVETSDTPHSVAVLFIDLDRFKPINDRYGHEAGDHLLCQVARRLRSCVRTTDIVARLGGDEFVIMLDLSLPGADPTLIGQRIVERIAHPFASSHGTLNVSVSVGLAYGGLGCEPREIVHRADLAAYQAKAAGGSRLVVATDASPP
jgi:diguanylate cyclase (GGDEF)-like protein/PAS domain S-box-containing protein